MTTTDEVGSSEAQEEEGITLAAQVEKYGFGLDILKLLIKGVLGQPMLIKPS